METFDIGRWHGKIVLSLGSFRFLHSFITDKDTLRYEASKYNWFNKEGLQDISDEPENKRVEVFSKEIRRATETYKQQTVVVLVTYTEGMISDFLQCLFTHYPSRMYTYLQDHDNKLKGKVDLKEIIEAKSFEKLIERLAVRATYFAMQGKFKSLISNMNKLCKVMIKESLSEELINLVEQRNRIVHEASDECISFDEIQMKFDIVENFLEYLGKVAIEENISINDPGFLVTPFPLAEEEQRKDEIHDNGVAS